MLNLFWLNILIRQTFNQVIFSKSELNKFESFNLHMLYDHNHHFCMNHTKISKMLIYSTYLRRTVIQILSTRRLGITTFFAQNEFQNRFLIFV